MCDDKEVTSQINHCCVCFPSLFTNKTLKSLHEIPDWQRDNEFLLTKYRPKFTVKESLISIFAIHNETINIWSHLLASIAFILILINNTTNLLIYNSFCFSASLCFFISSMLHTCLNTEKNIVSFLARLDYISIIIFTYSTFSTIVYFNNICVKFYLISYFIISLLIIFIVNCNEFEKSEYRSFRSLVFLLFGMFMLLPLIHSNNFDFYLLSELICLVSASYIFSRQIPEKYFIYKFDLVGHSHQILHILVVIVSIIHLKWMDMKISSFITYPN